MIHFEKFKLKNGLTVIVHQDQSTSLVAMNILYKVGARDEDPQRTGFAHLFEHLMFGGSVNIPDYDAPLQKAGGENNAFTNNDITNYYLTIPDINIETAFWLESDRMLSLAFSPKSLEVQKNVVIEEFKQRYLNQPYGDVWLNLRPLSYKVHPYQWATIGKEISHIENATLEDVKSFFKKYYTPDNAILCIAGSITVEKAKQLCEKWFEPIQAGSGFERNIKPEPVQTEKRIQHLNRNVPVNTIYKAWHCCGRTDTEFYATDLITDILSRGKSARIYNSLIKEKQLFSTAHCYQLGDLDKSLLVFEGRMNKGVDFEIAEKAIDDEIRKLSLSAINESELNKVKQIAESANEFGNMNVGDKALNLAYFELLGDAGQLNRVNERYNSVTAEEIKNIAQQIFRDENSNVLYYHAN